MPTTDTHLWDHDHPYYASEGNYFSTGCHAEFVSWADFFEAEGSADPELNLVYRWDWDKENRRLSLYYVGQRKALHRSASVTVVEADEPAVRAWLKDRSGNIAAIWEPFLEVR